MSARVRLAERAIEDLNGIRNWISSEADQATALAYVRRIAGRFNALRDFPEQGAPRPELKPGIRSLTFERSILILYRFEDGAVWIERIVSGKRNLDDLV